MTAAHPKITLVPRSQIQKAITEARSQWKETDRFNTIHHTREEIAAVVPEDDKFQHAMPSFYPAALIRHWIPLICSSQGHSTWHLLEVSRSWAHEIADLYPIWCAGRELRPETCQDLKALFPETTTAGIPTEEVFQAGKKWFLRVDYCSAKDSQARNSIVESVEDVIDRLYTSMRAVRALLDILEEEPSEKPKIFLLPFNPHMNPARENRVFCPPRLSRPAAISQYRWWGPLELDDQTSLPEQALAIYAAACNIYQDIINHAAQLDDRQVLDAMKKEGFTFDLLRTPSGEIQLVEINPFGAMSGCGSCLFQWIDDGKQLYGLKPEVELRYVVFDG
jgi:hypothetical protein